MPRKGRVIVVPVSNCFKNKISMQFGEDGRGRWRERDTDFCSEGVGVFMLERKQSEDGDHNPDPQKHNIPHLLQGQVDGFARSAYDDERDGYGDGKMHPDLDWPFHPERFYG
jgi:hypothetical protein